MKRPVIYESADVRITTELLPNSTSIIVFFSSFEEETWQALAPSEDSVRFREHSGVFVGAKSNHWWQVPDLAEMCAVLRQATRGYRDRIAYGTSMGGFGALMLSTDIGSTRVLALAPQTIISDPAMPMAAGWIAAIAQRPILRDNVPQSLSIEPEVLYDPHARTDLAHVRYLKARARIRERTFPHAGHKILKTFKECGILRDLVTTIFDAPTTEEGLRALYEPARHLSPSYLLNLGKSQVARDRLDEAQVTLAALEPLDARSAEDLRTWIEKRQAEAE